MLAAPNRLGKVMHYFASAYRYAAQKADPRRQVFYSALSAMADRDQYVSTDTMDVEQLMRLAITSAWFYSGVRLIADRVCSNEATFQVKRRVGEELRDIKNHEFELLLMRPNSLMTKDFLLAYQTFWYYLNGNAYFFIATDRPGEGEPEEIWPIPANACVPRPGTMRRSKLTGKPCIDYEYRVNGKEYLLPGENIIHLRNPNPFDYWQGLSFITAMLQAIRSDYEQGRYVEEFYGKDNAIPTAIISLAAEINEVDFETAKEQIREEFGARRRSAIIRGGDFTVQTITQTLQQSEFINSRKFNRDLIHHVLGIPAGLFSETMSGDSRLATEIAFTRNTVQPLLDRLAAEFTANVAPYYGDDYVIVAPSIIPQDRTLKINEYTAYAQDRSINENRKELGLPPCKVPDIFPEEIAQMVDIPIRLFPFITSNTFASSEPPMYANIEGENGLGDTPGLTGPDNQQIQDASLGNELVRVGIRAELQSWKKVALKEVREGRDPSSRPFITDAIPASYQRQIYDALKGADEAGVRHIFGDYINGVGHVQRSS